MFSGRNFFAVFDVNCIGGFVVYVLEIEYRIFFFRKGNRFEKLGLWIFYRLHKLSDNLNIFIGQCLSLFFVATPLLAARV